MVRKGYKIWEQQQLTEQEAWLRTLDYIQTETINLKNNLAAIIKNDIDKTLLEKAEDFQNEFLKKDTIISLLRHDIARQTKTEGGDTTVTDKKLVKLRSDMERVEKEFSKLKFDYYTCFSNALG